MYVCRFNETEDELAHSGNLHKRLDVNVIVGVNVNPC